MYSNAKAGDPALRLTVLLLPSSGWRSIEERIATPVTIERVTRTRIIIDGRQYDKITGKEHGGNACLIDPDNKPDRFNNTYPVMTRQEMVNRQRDFELFDQAFRYVQRHPKITQTCVYRAFKNDVLRREVLSRAAAFNKTILDYFEAYNVEIELSR